MTYSPERLESGGYAIPIYYCSLSDPGLWRRLYLIQTWPTRAQAAKWLLQQGYCPDYRGWGGEFSIIPCPSIGDFIGVMSCPCGCDIDVDI